MLKALIQRWVGKAAARPPAVAVPRDERVEALEAALLDMPQVNCPLKHQFAPGVYLREILMPAGTFIIGHRHKTEHFNVVLSGRARVMQTGGGVEEIVAPCVFVSKPGVRKILYILEDMRWATVHPTHETDVGVLERQLVEPSEAHRLGAREIQLLKEG
jgi:hypothetical protein